MATRKRPAQGHHLPIKPPRPSYQHPIVPKVVSAGTVSHPKDTRWRLAGHDAADATPKVIPS